MIQGIEVLNFWVPGPPKTKGSLTPRAPRCHCCSACRGYVGTPQLRDSVGSGRWRKLVAYQAEQAIKAVPPPERLFPVLAPVAVDLGFAVPFEDAIDIRAGDLDKHYRNVLDALTDARVYQDDRQVVRLSGYKIEAASVLEDPAPGVRVRVVI